MGNNQSRNEYLYYARDQVNALTGITAFCSLMFLIWLFFGRLYVSDHIAMFLGTLIGGTSSFFVIPIFTETKGPRIQLTSSVLKSLMPLSERKIFIPVIVTCGMIALVLGIYAASQERWINLNLMDGFLLFVCGFILTLCTCWLYACHHILALHTSVPKSRQRYLQAQAKLQQFAAVHQWSLQFNKKHLSTILLQGVWEGRACTFIYGPVSNRSIWNGCSLVIRIEASKIYQPWAASFHKGSLEEVIKRWPAYINKTLYWFPSDTLNSPQQNPFMAFHRDWPRDTAIPSRLFNAMKNLHQKLQRNPTNNQLIEFHTLFNQHGRVIGSDAEGIVFISFTELEPVTTLRDIEHLLTDMVKIIEQLEYLKTELGNAKVL